MNRAVDLAHGHVYVVSDLHGEWGPYAHYRDHFLSLYAESRAHHLVFLGDMIHGYGLPEEDESVEILLDLISLQHQLEPGTIMMLLGNHELAHIYFTPISKGEINFVPRFEHAMGEHRETIMSFLRSLPFVVRTGAGVMLTHAGAGMHTATPEAAQWLLNLSHEDLLAEVDHLLARSDVLDLLAAFGQVTPDEYEAMAREQFAVTGENDERYHDLLRGFIVNNLEPEWDVIWDFFFTQAEREHSPATYRWLLETFLEVFSAPGMPQRVLVAGHLPVDGGYEIVGDRQIRLASWAHARPRSKASYLLFDAAQPAFAALDLEPDIHRLP